ncbi:MAG: hypothetical protein MUC38_13560 [Cyclobacteriaceae bacterium]|jgi:hypothetical protein|nr:hypothetical protein [Cyclobacteriaceae bacterium]
MKKLLSVLVSLSLILSCDREKNEEKDCGCVSPTTGTIPESANLIGQIGYKVQLDPNDTYYNDKFWIGYTKPDCNNCIHHMIVCNEEILDDFQNLKNPPYENVQVRFSGHLKELCERTFHPADETFDHIILTSIEKQ